MTWDEAIKKATSFGSGVGEDVAHWVACDEALNFLDTLRKANRRPPDTVETGLLQTVIFKWFEDSGEYRFVEFGFSLNAKARHDAKR